MKYHLIHIFATLVVLVFISAGFTGCGMNEESAQVQFDPEAAPFEKLSEYHFFKGPIADLQPNDRVLPYDLNTPLFSDYAEKQRFIWMPEGESGTYNDSTHFDLPIGTVLIKNFYYPDDFRDENSPRNILETRLLLHRPDGWDAIPYVWNEEQTEAHLRRAGGDRPVEFVNSHGETVNVHYLIPNVNQCGSCHAQNNEMLPIGTAARHLNKDYDYGGDGGHSGGDGGYSEGDGGQSEGDGGQSELASQNEQSGQNEIQPGGEGVQDRRNNEGQQKEGTGVQNQLERWHQEGYLTSVPEPGTAPRLPDSGDSDSGPVDMRARAYLDINCGHCHNPTGSAKTSGLHLFSDVENPTSIGIFKSPVAAGRGTGGNSYSIVPGHPDNSILLYRMETTDPGIRMPELGRTLVDEEAVDLIREWIEEMPEAED